jgi:putative tricarboxylic transport membrane protein
MPCRSFRQFARAALLGCMVIASHSPVMAWQPTRPVELIVPAGTGGGADQMARAIQAIISKHNLMPVPLAVVNKAGNGGGEAFLDMQQANGEPHKLMITLSSVFTTPLATNMSFSWRELTPVAKLALDQFVLWVHADDPIQNVADYIAAVRAAAPGEFKMGGTGSKQEDQIVTAEMERIIGARLTYIAFRGGGEVAEKLAARAVNSTVNNPIEALKLWREGKLRPLCVFTNVELPHADKVVGNWAWLDIPTCRAQGLRVEYEMLRGVFMPTGVTPEQQSYYVGVMGKIRETPEWRALMREGAFSQIFQTGNELGAWMEREDRRHRRIMQNAGLIAP